MPTTLQQEIMGKETEERDAQAPRSFLKTPPFINHQSFPFREN